jgi:hypothetical protein
MVQQQQRRGGLYSSNPPITNSVMAQQGNRQSLGSSYNPSPMGGIGGGAGPGGDRRGGGMYTGAGDPFTEAGLNDYVYRDPSLFLEPMFDQRFGTGWDQGAGGIGGNLYGMMSSAARNINPLYTLFRGQGAGPAQAGGAGFTNFAQSFLQNQLTPGVYTDVAGGIGNLQNPSGLLATYLFGGGDAATQVQRYLELARGLAAQGMHPMLAEAYLEDVARQGKGYIAGTAQGQAMGAGGFGGYAGGRSSLY